MSSETQRPLLTRMDDLPVLRPHIKLALIGGLGLMFDGMDGSLVSYILPIIRPLWHLDGAQTGLIGSSLLIGILIGSIAAGVIGDRVGRRRVMMYALALYAVASAVAAASQGWEFFFTMRVIAGIGIGAESAIIPTFIAEFIPKRRRGFFVGAVAGFFAFGYICAALLGTTLVAGLHDGWRLSQLVTALPIAMLLWWRRSLPESPRWLLTRGRSEEAQQIVDGLERGQLVRVAPMPASAVGPFQPAGGRAKPPLFRHLDLWRHGTARRTAVLWLLWTAVTFSFYGFFTWIPSLLVARGMTIASSFTLSLIMTVAQIPGYYSASYLNERFSRRVTIAVYLLGGAGSAFLLSQASTEGWVVVSGSLLSFFMNGCYAGLYAYTPEVYSTELRATGMGTASAVGRIGGIVAPILIGATFSVLGFGGVFTMLMAVLGVAALVVLALGVPTRGRALEEIAAGAASGPEQEPGPAGIAQEGAGSDPLAEAEGSRHGRS
ncbi:MFS transporter [Sinomonas gamaensis]|uniref:MFS transporter n=1 Tax=Sinomonas gamaensis TaxID=2565624 RepID=UPI001108280A|nr:MFS transporter [Sinomonas gamaensis]